MTKTMVRAAAVFCVVGGLAATALAQKTAGTLKELNELLATYGRYAAFATVVVLGCAVLAVRGIGRLHHGKTTIE